MPKSRYIRQNHYKFYISLQRLLRANAIEEDVAESIFETPVELEPWKSTVEYVAKLSTWIKVEAENPRLMDAFRSLSNYAMKCPQMSGELGRESLGSDMISDMLSVSYIKKLHFKESLLASSKYNFSTIR